MTEVDELSPNVVADARVAFPAGRQSNCFVHVPWPDDNYSPSTGSAIVTIIYEMSRVHAEHGGTTKVVVTRGKRHDYPVGEIVAVDPTGIPSRWKKAVDVGLGRLALPRLFGGRAYGPACSAIERNFDGLIFVHNNPVAISRFKHSHPKARVCLWANNELFRTYTPRETRRVVRDADRVICCSRYIANDLEARLGTSSEKIRVVHNGADLRRFRPDACRRVDTPPVVLFIGRVTPIKGPDLLIKAALKIFRADRPFELRIVGSSGFSASDPLTQYECILRDLAKPMGSAVVFKPFVDRAAVVEEYQAASIFCAPSNWNEPVSLTVPEALASGLPTIAARRGGIPEVGGNAVQYFDPPDVDQLAVLLDGLLNDPENRRQWGDRAIKQASRLSWEKQYAALLTALA
jgi:glycosyltransferase involved in cell wall biosynthesis